MPEIGAYEAKTHFTITKHGRPVAELIPVPRKDPEGVRQTIKAIRSYRETLRNLGITIQKFLHKTETLRDVTHPGHRY